MTTTTSTEPTSSAVVSLPLQTEVRVEQSQTDGTSMTAVISTLASLRERYYSELQAARTSVKKNFLTR